MIPPLGLGGASLGDLYVTIPNSQALETVEQSYHSGVRLFDTSPWYGLGLSESRMGCALYRYPRASYLLSTKVGRFLVPDPERQAGEHGWLGGKLFRPVYDWSGP